MSNIEPLHEILTTIAVSVPRLLAIFAVLPFMNRNIISGIVRNSIILALVLLIYPMVVPQMPHPLSMNLMLAVIVKEIILGIILGFLISLFFWVAESVGFFIDNQRGTTMASVFNPMSGEQTSPLGSVFLQLTAVLFFTGGGFLALLAGLFESYQVWPVFSFFPSINQTFPLFILRQADHFMAMVVLFAAPIIIAVFLAEFGLGLMNRFAPQLNVFFLAMPIKSGIAAFLLILYLYGMSGFLKESMPKIEHLFPRFQEMLGV